MVNSIKLTKLERRVLKALFEKRVTEYGSYPDEGNNVEGIAKIVYGDKVLHRERIGGHYVSNLSVCYSAKSSLSRVLKQLVKKGLVKRCTPYYHGRWEGVDKESGSVGFWNRRLLNLSSCWVDEEGDWRKGTISIGRFTVLPHGTRVWWVLTDRGKADLEEITGKGGHRSIYTAKYNEAGTKRHMAKKILSKLLETWPEATKDTIEIFKKR